MGRINQPGWCVGHSLEGQNHFPGLTEKKHSKYSESQHLCRCKEDITSWQVMQMFQPRQTEQPQVFSTDFMCRLRQSACRWGSCATRFQSKSAAWAACANPRSDPCPHALLCSLWEQKGIGYLNMGTQKTAHKFSVGLQIYGEKTLCCFLVLFSFSGPTWNHLELCVVDCDHEATRQGVKTERAPLWAIRDDLALVPLQQPAPITSPSSVAAAEQHRRFLGSFIGTT